MAGTIAHEATQRTYGSRGQETKWTDDMDDLEGGAFYIGLQGGADKTRVLTGLFVVWGG